MGEGSERKAQSRSLEERNAVLEAENQELRLHAELFISRSIEDWHAFAPLETQGTHLFVPVRKCSMNVPDVATFP